MAALKWILLVTGGAYLALLLLMYVMQRSLMYFPETVRTAPAQAGFAQAEEVELTSADGERLVAWHVAPRGGKPVVVYFHGNGGALQHRVPRFKPLVADGTGLIALSYRGYGGSSGSPSEPGLQADAVAVYDFAAARYGAERIVLWGESIGGGVAVPLAAQKPVQALILEAPFSSAVDLASSIYPFLPVRLLMKDQFRSIDQIARVRAPLLILHGTADSIVPIAFGEKLFAAAAEPKRFVRLQDGGHNNLDAFGALAKAKEFLQTLN